MSTYIAGLETSDPANWVLPVVLADFINKRGVEAEAVAFAEPAGKAAYLLDRFGLLRPALVTSLAGKKLILAGDRETEHLPDRFADVDLVDSFCHAELRESRPGSLFTPVGLTDAVVWPDLCLAALVPALYAHHNMELTRGQAGALLGLIILDQGLEGLAAGKRDFPYLAALVDTSGLDILEAFRAELDSA